MALNLLKLLAIPLALVGGTCADQFIVTLRPGGALPSSHGATIDDLGGGMLLVEGDTTARTALMMDDNVLSIDDNDVVRLDPSDVDSGSDVVIQGGVSSWGLDRVDGARDGTFVRSNFDGKGVSVYIVDTGVFAGHDDFGGRVKSGRNFAGDNGPANVDCHGHGTHVASTAAGKIYGVATAASIVPVKVLSCSGSGSAANVIKGVNWAAARSGRKVISLSLGGGFNTAMNNAIEAAIKKGAVVVVAAGNSNSDACRYSPSSATGAITVGSTDIKDRRSSFSNKGSCIDIFAPGSLIPAADIGSKTAVRVRSGTSMACPHVSGVCATILQESKSASPAKVQAIVNEWAETGVVSDPDGSPNLFLNNQERVKLPTLRPTKPTPTKRPTTSMPTQQPTGRYKCNKEKTRCECLATGVCEWFGRHKCRQPWFCGFNARSGCNKHEHCMWTGKRCTQAGTHR